MEYQKTTTNSFPSFPANYVTLAQLKERWLKVREGNQREERDDLNQLEEDRTSEPRKLSECDSVAIAGEEETKTKKTTEEFHSPPSDVEARAEESDSRVFSANRGTGKWVVQGRNRERRELAEKPEAGPKSRVLPVEENGNGSGRGDRGKARAESSDFDRTAGIAPRSRHLCVNLENGIKNCENSNTRNEDMPKNNGTDEKAKEDFPVRSVKSRAFPVEEKGNGGGRGDRGKARAESSGFDRTAGIDPRSSHLCVNLENGIKNCENINTQNEDMPKNNGTDEKAKEDFPARTVKSRVFPVEENGNGSGREDRGKARAESSGFDRTADIDPMSRHLCVNLENGMKSCENRNTRNEDKPKNNGTDEKAKEDFLARRNREGRKTETKTGSESNVSDCKADIEPKDVDGLVSRRNGKDDIKPKSMALPVNEGLRKKKGGLTRGNPRNEQGRSGSKSESNVSGQKVRVTSVRGGFRRNDQKDSSLEIEKMLERFYGEDQKDEIKPESMAFPVNEGSKKNGKNEDLWARKNRKGGKIGEGSNDDLAQAAGSEPKLMVMSIHGGFWRDGGLTLETGIEAISEMNGEDRTADIEPELKALSVNEGPRKKRKNKKWLKRRNLENGQTIGDGRPQQSGFEQTADSDPKVCDSSIEMGVEATVEGNGEDQRAGIGTEPRTPSVNEESGKNGKKKQGRGGRDRESSSARGKARPESERTTFDREPNFGVLSTNGSARKGNRGSNRNGGKEVSREPGEDRRAGIKPGDGSKKKLGETVSESNELGQMTAIEPKVGVSCVKSFAGKGNGEGSRRSGEKVESQGFGIEPEFKALPVIGGTRNENREIRRTSSSRNGGYRESRSNVPERFRDGVRVWVKKQEFSGS